METSDDSFAWTDASSDSSKDKVVEMKPNKSKQRSDKYEAHKDESHSEPETIQVEKKHKDKKRKKHDFHEEIENDNINDQTNRSIKSEPNSDFDVSKKRQKCDETRISSNYDESFGEAEDYLNLRVKQEQATFVEPTAKKAKKKKKDKGVSKTSQEQEFNDIEKYNLDNSCLLNSQNSDINDKDISFRKKKKKKKKLSIDNDMSEILDDSEDSHKTKKKKKYKDLLQNEDSDGNNFQHEVENNSQIISSTLLYNSIKENVKEEFNNDVQSVVSLGNSTSTSQKSGKTEGPLKKACRISDRLRFEEDSIDYEPRENALKNDISIQLEQFISSNINLRSLQADFHSDPGISDDDEVWILKGPHDISIEDLENAKLTLDGKKKVKINGNTYDTIIDTTICAAPILLFKKEKIFMKNKSLKGAINLRKRIPKIHIPYESLMENNESSFIPLPETKCRHPLFGIHYENATKVAPEIAERLDSSIVPNAMSKKKKKHREKREIESDIEVKPNIEVLHSSKKKRQIEQKLENESDIEVKPNIAEPHFNKKRRKMKERLEMEPDIEEKPIIEALHSNKKKKQMQENLRVESDSEMKSSIEGSHSKKKKRKNKDRLRTESDTDVKPSIEVLHFKKKKRKNKEILETESDVEMKLSMEVSESNKKKRKHSDDPGKKAKRVKRDPSSAEAWESEQAIEKNLFDF